MSERRVPRGEPETKASPLVSEKVWDAAVSEWIAACVRSSPISHDVGAWNRLNEVLPRLREILNNALSAKE